MGYLQLLFLNKGYIAKICLQMVNAVSYMKSFPHVHVYCNAIDIWVFVEKNSTRNKYKVIYKIFAISRYLSIQK